MSWSSYIRISRPRFWIYLLGPFLIGFVSGLDQFPIIPSWNFWVWFIYFLLPANLLIYGVNDIFDHETDRINPKKSNYETLLPLKAHRNLILLIIAFHVPFLMFLPSLSWMSLFSLGGFLFFGIQYSAPPIRAKSKPLFDSLFNILYIMPGIFGYGLITQNIPSPSLILSAGLWAMAMHSYSAIPDIRSDKKAQTPTIATLLEFYGTLLYCITLYGISYLLVIPILSIWAHIFGLIYLTLMIITWIVGESKAFSIYKAFPWVNTIVGFVLFWIITIDILS